MRASVGRERMSNSAIMLGTFRSAATAWVAARFHTFAMSDRFHEIKHDARMAGGAEDAGNTPASNAPAAAHFAMMAAISVFSQRPPQSSMNESRIVNALYSLPVKRYRLRPPALWGPTIRTRGRLFVHRNPQWIANREVTNAERMVWNAAWEDIRLLETRPDEVETFLAQSLWLTSAPECVSEERNLSARLRRVEENWSVWVDWYEARLIGRVELSDSNETARVSWPSNIRIWADIKTSSLIFHYG
jgi:hypothetical protein